MCANKIRKNNMKFKEFLKRLSIFGLEVNFAFDSGFSVCGLNISRSRHPYSSRSSVALNRCLSLDPNKVLDVGSGGGDHALAFKKIGAQVTCIDFGTSIYAKNMSEGSGLNVINTDFQNWRNQDLYDLVWASHVLEHQRNCGSFIEKLLSCCHPNGKVAITVPVPHRKLWSGHLTLWTPGLLAYNIILCGVDLRDAEILYGYREISIIFSPKYVQLPELTFDSGDLLLLQNCLPKGLSENSDSWL